MSLLDLLPAETLDAITAGVEREPLVGAVAPVVRAGTHACTQGENDYLRPTISFYPECAGCVAAVAPFIVRHNVWNNAEGRAISARQWLATYLDEFDPQRILIERELARRGNS